MVNGLHQDPLSAANPNKLLSRWSIRVQMTSAKKFISYRYYTKNGSSAFDPGRADAVRELKKPEAHASIRQVIDITQEDGYAPALCTFPSLPLFLSYPGSLDVSLHHGNACSNETHWTTDCSSLLPDDHAHAAASGVHFITLASMWNLVQTTFQLTQQRFTDTGRRLVRSNSAPGSILTMPHLQTHSTRKMVQQHSDLHARGKGRTKKKKKEEKGRDNCIFTTSCAESFPALFSRTTSLPSGRCRSVVVVALPPPSSLPRYYAALAALCAGSSEERAPSTSPHHHHLQSSPCKRVGKAHLKACVHVRNPDWGSSSAGLCTTHSARHMGTTHPRFAHPPSSFHPLLPSIPALSFPRRA